MQEAVFVPAREPIHTRLTSFSRIVIFLLIEGLRFFKFQMMAPFIVLNFGLLLFVPFILISLLVGSGSSAAGFTPRTFSLPLSLNLQIGNEEILKLYGLLSLVSYLFIRLLNRFLKIKINVPFKKKITLLISLDIVLFLLFFGGIYMVNRTRLIDFLVPLLITTLAWAISHAICLVLCSVVDKSTIVLQNILTST